MKNETEIRKEIGKKIRLARANHAITQEKLAERTGLSTRYISQIERGLAFGSASTIVSICKALDVTPDFLFGNTVHTNVNDLDKLVDNKFAETYLKLDEKNKFLINNISSQLLKLQHSEKSKETSDLENIS